MSRAAAGGTASLSIDLELAIGRQTTQGQDRLEAVTAALIEMLDGQGISATWGVSNPALSAATDVILASESPQEIAVLGERFWLGDGTPPSRLAQEFRRRFEGTRRQGLQISTLLLRQTADYLDLNLLLGHGIAAVRGPAVAASADPSIIRAGSLRFGICQVQSPILIPLSGSWWNAEQWAFRQRLDGALRSEAPLHLVLDAARMAELADLGMPVVASVIRRLGEMRESRQFRFATLEELARENLSRRVSHPSRSILAA